MSGDALDSHPTETVLQFGGITFGVSFRGPGATMRVSGRPEGELIEMLRFDDFIDTPHFHAPASGPPIDFDRSLGEPLAWFVVQVRDRLGEWLQRCGFEAVLSGVDLDEVSKNADQLTQAMIACVPDGYVRVPGVGLQRLEVPA